MNRLRKLIEQDEAQREPLPVKTLYKGKYINFVTPEFSYYECVDGSDCVVVLPVMKMNAGGIKYGIRKEFCPCTMVKGGKRAQTYSLITGGIEKGEKPLQAAIRELEEEAGVVLTESADWKTLGTNIAAGKFTTIRYQIFSVVFPEQEIKTPEGDGTANEEKSETLWVTPDELKALGEDHGNLTDILLFYAVFFNNVAMQMEMKKDMQ